MIGVDKKRKSKHLSSPAVIYSLFLRARGAYIVRCLLHGKAYSAKRLRQRLAKKGIVPELYNRLYSVYSAERDGKKPKEKITLPEAEKFLAIVKSEIESII